MQKAVLPDNQLVPPNILKKEIMHPDTDWHSFLIIKSLLKSGLWTSDAVKVLGSLPTLYIQSQSNLCIYTTHIMLFFVQKDLVYTTILSMCVWAYSAGLWSVGWLTTKSLKWYLLPLQNNINTLTRGKNFQCCFFVYLSLRFIPILFCNPNDFGRNALQRHSYIQCWGCVRINYSRQV